MTNFRENVWKIALIGILWTAIALPFPLSTQAGISIKKVTVTGTAFVKGDNIAGAHQKAIEDALRQALEQGVGMVMDSVSIIKNDDLMDKIYTNTQGYITSYKIIKEEREPNGLYSVKIEAMVKPGALKETLTRLGLVKAMMDYPRIMIIPSASNIESTASRAAETAITKRFTDKSFDIVDYKSNKALHKELGKLSDKPVGWIKRSESTGKLKHYAEIVILYEVQSGKAEFDGIMENAPVSLSIKAVTTTEGKILTSDRQDVVGVGQSRDGALRNGGQRAAEEISEYVIQSILTWWTDYIANGTSYIITLNTNPNSGLSGLQSIAFQQALESIPGVVSLTERISGGGITEMMIRYRGNSMLLKREIITGCSTAEGLENLHSEASKGRLLVFSVR